MARIAPAILLILALCPQVLPGEERKEAARDFSFLGVVTAPKVAGDEKSGLVVTYVYPGSAAEEMAFKVGDEVLIVNDLVVQDRNSFVEELRRTNVGGKARFRIRRGGEELQLQGRMGSYYKSMAAYQEIVRKEFIGKPLPPLPAALRWNATEKKWEPGPTGWEELRGKVGIVFSLDDCPVCRDARLRKLSLLKAGLSTAVGTKPLAFSAVYYDERQGKAGKEANMKAAAALFEEIPPPFTAAVAYYTGATPTVEERRQQFLMHHHGIAILDPEGLVTYVQVLGAPERVFAEALRKAIGLPDPPQPTGEATPGGTAPQQPGQPAPPTPPAAPGPPASGGAPGAGPRGVEVPGTAPPGS